MDVVMHDSYTLPYTWHARPPPRLPKNRMDKRGIPIQSINIRYSNLGDPSPAAYAWIFSCYLDFTWQNQHAMRTASWCWCHPGTRSVRARQAKSSNLAAMNLESQGSLFGKETSPAFLWDPTFSDRLGISECIRIVHDASSLPKRKQFPSG